MLPSVGGCCETCEEQPSVQVPGPQGDPGADGTNGTDGINAFTTAPTGFNMPTYGGNTASLTVGSSEWMLLGQIVWVSGGAFSGFMQVVSKADSTHVVLKNLDDNAGAYADNSAPGSPFPNGTEISPGGQQGPAGSTPGGTYFAITNNLSEGVAATMRGNLGLGTVAVEDEGVSNGQVALNDGNLTTNEAVFGTGTGIATRDAATARGLLGLTLGTSDTDVAPVDGGGGLVVGDIVIATANGIITATAADIRTLLGVAQADQLLYQHQTATNVDGAAVTAGAWTTVPMTNEVVDVGNHGSLAANVITLDAGTYSYRFMVMVTTGDPAVFLVGRLFNVTDAAVVSDSYGTTGYVDPAGGTHLITSIGNGRFVIAGAKGIRVECQIPLAKTAIYGKGANNSVNNVFSWFELWKEA